MSLFFRLGARLTRDLSQLPWARNLVRYLYKGDTGLDLSPKHYVPSILSSQTHVHVYVPHISTYRTQLRVQRGRSRANIMDVNSLSILSLYTLNF